MLPQYFGPIQSPLFGLYTPPSSGLQGEWGVVFCYPGPHEMARMHRAFRALAQQLEKIGFATFRFDYSCTGDSAGLTTDADAQRWLLDIQFATEEFKAISGVKNVIHVGLRLGATLLAVLANQWPQSQQINYILWDPVIYGQEYLNELNFLENLRLRLSRYPLEKNRNAKKTECLGFEDSEKLTNGLTKLTLENVKIPINAKIHVILTHKQVSAVAFGKWIKGLSSFNTVNNLDEDLHWKTKVNLEEISLPHKSLAAIKSLCEGLRQ